MAAILLDVTLTLDTAIYASGDVLAATQTIASAYRVNGGRAVLESLVVVDQDDLGIALDVWFLDTNVAIGTENAAPSITDADALKVLGRIAVAAADYVDLGGVRIATVRDLALVLENGDDSKNLYVAAVTGGAPTHTASGLVLRIGLILH